MCGSFTNLLKIQIGAKKEGDASETSSQLSVNVDQTNAETLQTNNEVQEGGKFFLLLTIRIIVKYLMHFPAHF